MKTATRKLPLFPVTQVGSWIRSEKMLRALRDRRVGKLATPEFEQIAREEIARTIRIQEDAGVDLVVDGEHHRDNFYSFLTERVDGAALMSLADMLDTVEDKAGFEEMLATLDVPASAIRNPTCTGKLSRREPLAVREFEYVASLTDLPVKATLPGPYLLTRSMWVTAYSKSAYRDKTDMADDIVAMLHDELTELRDAGCAMVQFDEPVLTEVILSKEKDRRTFM